MVRYVIIGNGVAGTTAAANIRKIDSEGRIIIIADEAYSFYSRIRLADYLSGEVDERGLTIKRDNWYEENRIELILNTPVTGIDNEKKEVITSSGDRIKYDRLLLATGGVPFVPPIPGTDRKGVFTLRRLKDALAIREYAGKVHRVLILGGGVLGLEAGNGFRKAGNSITVVEFLPRLLPRQMDPEGAEVLKAQMEEMGFKFYLGAKSREIIGDNQVEALVLEDGRRIECDMIIISAGVRPNAVLAQGLGLKVERGLVVNDRMETGLSDIYAAGDLIQHRGLFYGIWPAAERQGEVAGITMAGGNAAYEGTTVSNMLKIAGIALVAAGDIDAEGEHESIVLRERDNFIYRKLVIKENTIAGTILYGDIKEMGKVLRAIEDKRDISGIRRELEQWNLAAL